MWGYHDACGRYHEYLVGVQYHDGYHPLYIEYCWGDIMIHVGEYHENHGVFSTAGILK